MTSSPYSAYFGPEKIYLIVIDGAPYGFVPMAKGPDVFSRIVMDKKVQIEQDLGHTVSEVCTTDAEKGEIVIILESPTRSYVYGGMRQRCKLELKKISVLVAHPDPLQSERSTK
jgi:hypothetical protein